MHAISEKSRNLYKTSFQAASSAGAAYDGSKESETRFLGHLLKLEEIMRQSTGAQKIPASIELEFARAARVTTPLTIDEMIHSALGLLYRELARLPVEQVIGRLRSAGARVQEHDQFFVKPDHTDLHNPAKPAKSAGGQHDSHQPRLAWLAEGLREIGFYTEDMVIHIGTTPIKHIRQRPYYIIDLPKADRQIAFCENVGSVTYVSDKILSSDIYSVSTPAELKMMPSISAVPMRSHDEWIERIQTLIGNADPDAITNLKIRLSAQPLTEEKIIKSAQEWHEKYGGWPTLNSGDITFGTLRGNNWGSLDNTLRRAQRGLEIPYAGLADFLEQKGLKISRNSKAKNLSESDIIVAAKAWHKELKKWPSQYSGEIPDGKLKGESWGNIHSALRRGDRGLPDRYTGLPDFLEQNGLKISRQSASRKLTEDLIIQGLNEWHTQHHSWPNQKSGKILSGTLAGNDWLNISMALREGRRGLTTTYKSISDFLIQKGMKEANSERAITPVPQPEIK